MRIRMFLLALGCSLGIATNSYAATDQADLSVGAKTLSLLVNKIQLSANASIIFNPADTASKAEADSIKAIFDGGFEAPGGVKLTGVLVPVNDLEKMEGSKIAILTSGLKASFDAIAASASAKGILTMSTDLECVKSNKCVLGMVSKPSVEIYYSKAAADAAKISFSPAFAMLVKQI